MNKDFAMNGGGGGRKKQHNRSGVYEKLAVLEGRSIIERGPG